MAPGAAGPRRPLLDLSSNGRPNGSSEHEAGHGRTILRDGSAVPEARGGRDLRGRGHSRRHQGTAAVRRRATSAATRVRRSHTSWTCFPMPARSSMSSACSSSRAPAKRPPRPCSPHRSTIRIRGAVTWKSTVGTNVASDALANLASAGVIGRRADRRRRGLRRGRQHHAGAHARLRDEVADLAARSQARTCRLWSGWWSRASSCPRRASRR